MKAKLTIDGKEFEVEMDDNEAKAMLSLKTLCEKKKTGYERVETGSKYYTAYASGESGQLDELYTALCDCTYENANYYSDETVAENNARADKLYRQLRRFAVEHRENKIDWNDDTLKYYIYYSHSCNGFFINGGKTHQHICDIYFDTRETAQLALDTFKDELLWYFTEYKDSL